MIWKNPIHRYLDHNSPYSGNNLFDQFIQGVTKDTGSEPPVNIWTNDDNIILIAELPGCNLESFDISCRSNVISVSYCNRNDSEEVIYPADFKRSFELPYKVDENKTEAVYKDGLLQVMMPRSERDKPKKIEIKG